MSVTRGDATTAIRFPIQLLTAACLLTIMAFACLGWIIFDARRDVKVYSAQLARIEQLRGIIADLDEVLTMSARMAAATGDSRWEERYRHFEPQLDAAIKESIKTGASSSDGNAARKTDDANIKLVEMENRAFALVRDGHKEEAQAIFFSPEYEAQKKIYADGMISFDAENWRKFYKDRSASERVDLFSLVAALAVAGTSFAAWLLAMRGMRRWHAHLLENVRRRDEAEQNLREGHAQLEMRVEERTTELAETNRILQSENNERKHAEEILRSSEERFRSMFEQSGVGMAIVDGDGRLHQVNQAYCRFLGYNADELIGLSLRTLTDPRDVEATQLHFDGLRAGTPSEIELEKRYVHKNGTVVWGRVSAHFLAAGDGHRHYLAIVQDITARKAADLALQQAEEKYRSIFENAAEGIYQMTPQGEFLAINPAAARILGFSSPEQMLNKPDRTSFGYVDPRRLKEFLRLVEEQAVVTDFVSEIFRPDGSRVWVLENVRVIRGASGEILFFEGTIEDITERTRREAEGQVISEIVQSVITTTNLGELFEFARHSIGKVLSAENCFVALHNPATNLMHFEFWADKLDPIPAPQPVGDGLSGSSYILRTGQPLLLTTELKNQLHDKGAIELIGTDSSSWLGVPLRTPIRTIGVLAVQDYEKEGAYTQRDLEFLSSVGDQIALAIERKQAEEELRRSEERLAAAQKMAHVGSWEWDVITNKVVWSDEEYRLFGLEPSEREWSYGFYLSLVHPEARRDAMRWFNAVRAMKKSSRMDIRIVRPDGQERILNSWADVVLDEAGNVVRVIGTSQDVTEREKAERALGESEERFQLVSRATNDAIWDWDMTTHRISFSESFETLFGYRAGEFESTLAFWTHAVHPEDRDQVMAGLDKFCASREEAWSADYRFRCADGSYAFVFDRGYVVRDGEGKAVRMAGSMMNMTERKRAEAERRVISEIVQGVITTSNLDGLLELAHRSIGKLLYAENCFVGLHDPKTDLMAFDFMGG